MNCQSGYFAVIDTETNYNDEVMSIGITFAKCDDFEAVGTEYYILTREAAVGGMFSYTLETAEPSETKKTDRKTAIEDIKRLFREYSTDKIFAYNARFDKSHLPELSYLRWFDIMKIAAYKQYKRKIPDCCPLCRTGRMKNNFGVESILQMLSENNCYTEMHNALQDSIDELEIMRLLGLDFDTYYAAEI